MYIKVTAQDGTILHYKVTVTVEPIPLIIPTGATSFTDTNGVEWLILKDNRQTDGTIFIVTKHVYGGGESLGWNSPNTGKKYHDTDVFVKYENSKGGFKPAMDLWYDNFVSERLKDYACVPVLGYENDNWTEMDNYYLMYQNVSKAYSTPGAKAGVKPDGIVFPLSISEVNQYISATSSELRKAFDTGGTARYWWLRSPGFSATYPASNVNTDGNINYNSATITPGLRPAMWININQ